MVKPASRPERASPAGPPKTLQALFASGLALLLITLACDGQREIMDYAWAEPPVVPPSDLQSFEVPPPPFSDGIFPCSDCHASDIPVNRERRDLELVHSEIELMHGGGQRWCLDCHSADNRDFLQLASGETVPFEQSYRLCGQCHGDKYRDWRAGIHGRRKGRWDGEKEYMLCVHCHDAHSPRFPPIEPMPAPVRPQRSR